MLTIQLSVLPEQAFNEEFLKKEIEHKTSEKEFDFKILKRSIDARRRPVKINLKIAIYQKGKSPKDVLSIKKYGDVSKSGPVIVVGFGPAGMFAALKLIEKGLKPIVIERGKDVRTRRRDLAAITKDHVVNTCITIIGS